MSNQTLDVIDDEISSGQEAPAATNSALAADLDRARRQADEERESRRTEYAQILGRHNDAKPGDGARLIEIAAELGSDPDADLRIIQQSEAMEKSLETKAEMTARRSQVDADLASIQREFTRMREEFAMREIPLIQESARLNTQLRDLGVAESTLVRLKSDNWKIFNFPDPAKTAKTKRIFSRVIDGGEVDGGYCLENTMTGIGIPDWTPFDTRFNFTGSDWAISAARQIARAHKPAYYIVTQAERAQLKSDERCLIVDGDILLPIGIWSPPPEVIWLPFQDSEEIRNERMEQIAKKLKKDQKHRDQNAYRSV